MITIPEKYKTRYFFHFTHIENLDSIVKNGLLCTNLKKKKGIDHFNIASEGIQERRSTMKVSCGPGGNVHDYVPFYFCSVNPMFLSMLNSKNVDQPLIVILAISIDKILRKDVIFTDASANTKEPPNFFESPEDLEKLSWETIDGKKWKCADDDERHRRMAEVLFYERVPVDFIDYIIVWNDDIKKEVTRIFTDNGIDVPKLSFSPFKTKYKFHFTKFMFTGRDGETLITGPHALKARYIKTIKTVIENRKKLDPTSDFRFDNIQDCLSQLKADFTVIKELEGIFELETVNDVHNENVSDHTLNVIKELENLQYYKEASKDDKRILKLSAYLHDIGKGPKNKWKDSKQPAYPDHPADAPKMLIRILSEDFRNLSNYEVRMICLLVTYHDLIGEIFGKGRNEQQLIDIIESEKDFDMLSTLNFADVNAINFDWSIQYSIKIKNFKKKILAKKGL